MTIGERAENHLHERMVEIARLVERNNLSKEVRQSITYHCYLDYMIGATEQKAIDIDNHWNWIKAFANVTMGIDISAYEDMFKKKAMEEHGEG